MVLFYLALAVAGFLALYFTDKYARETAFSAFLRSRDGKTGKALGWALLTISLAVAIWTHGWGTGLFFLVVAAMFIASAFVLFIPLLQKK